MARASERRLGTRRLQRRARHSGAVALLAGTCPPSAAIGYLPFSLAEFDPALGPVWWRRHDLRDRRRFAGQVPSAAGARPAGRRGPLRLPSPSSGTRRPILPSPSCSSRWSPPSDLLGLRWLPGDSKTRPSIHSAGSAPSPARPRPCRCGGTGVRPLLRYDPRRAGRALPAFLDNAYSEGGGRNVVNVILVDFRGFEHAGRDNRHSASWALTTYYLLRRFARPPTASLGPQTATHPERVRDRARRPREGHHRVDFLFVPSVIMRWLFP